VFKTIIDRLSLYQLLSCVLIIIVMLALTVYRLEGGTKDSTTQQTTQPTPTPQATSRPTEAPTQIPQPTAEPQPIKITSLGEFRYTYYDSCIKCCGKTDKITFTGVIADSTRTVAVDKNVIPLGSYLYIEGIGIRRAEDTGGLVKGKLIDIYVDKHEDRQIDKGQVYLLGGVR